MKTDIKDIVWVAMILVSAIGIGVVWWDSWLIFAFLVVSLLSAALMSIGRIEGIGTGLIASCLWSWLFYQNYGYEEVMLHLGFFVPAYVVAFFTWRKRMRNNVVEMLQLTWGIRAVVAFAVIVLSLIHGFNLSQKPLVTFPYIKGSLQVLPMAAALLMIFRRKEQWILNVFLYANSIIMWVILCSVDGMFGGAYCGRWVIHLAISIFGYWRWNKGAKIRSRLQESVESPPPLPGKA